MGRGAGVLPADAAGVEVCPGARRRAGLACRARRRRAGPLVRGLRCGVLGLWSKACGALGRWSEAGAAGAGLAPRAAVGGAVHERVAPDRGAARAAFLALSPVDRERPLEVAALAVDVDVQAVERGPADGQGFGEDLAHRLEEPGDLGAVQRFRRPGPVQAGPPQRLIGVDVADPADQRLIEQGALDPGVPGA